MCKAKKNVSKINFSGEKSVLDTLLKYYMHVAERFPQGDALPFIHIFSKVLQCLDKNIKSVLCCWFAVAWMMCKDFFAQGTDVDVGVYLRCGDALVAEHLLDSAQIGSALQQGSGEGVA